MWVATEPGGTSQDATHAPNRRVAETYDRLRECLARGDDAGGEDGDGARYVLQATDHEVCLPGDAGVVDPRSGSDVHSVYSPVRSRSLHVYPDDNYHAHGYVFEGTEEGRDLFRRERFELRE